MRIIRNIIIASFLSLYFTGYAQQDIMFTQYMFNGMAINPAYAGSHDALSLTALYRKQWVNIEGAPSSLTFSAHSPLPKERWGVGLLLSNDKIGINNVTNIMASGSYYIPVSEKGKLALGIQLGINSIRSDFSDLTVDDPNDEYLQVTDVTAMKPNIGAGLYYYTNAAYIGFSAPRLLQNNFENQGVVARKQQRHYFLTGGHIFTLSPNFKIKPNFMMKVVEGAPIELDLNANVLFIERLWLGLSWRSLDSFDAIIQFHVNEQLSIGYAYDFTTTELGNYTSGSHEIMINYLFKFDKYKVLTPRYF